MPRTSASEYATSFLLGGLLGAGLMLLFAPQSGRETRERIGDAVRDGADRARRLRDQAIEKSRELGAGASDFVEKQRQGLQSRKERLSAAIEAGREAYREEKSQA